MAGCVPCFIIPLLLFIFHRYIQPILLKFWNPWAKIEEGQAVEGSEEKNDISKQCLSNWSCPCAPNKDAAATDGKTGVETEECKKTN